MWRYVLEQPRRLVLAVVATVMAVGAVVQAPQSPESAAASDAGPPPPPGDPLEAPEGPPEGASEGPLEGASEEAPEAAVALSPAPPLSPSSRYRALAHDAAGTCPGLPAGVLFAIAEAESNHGRDKRVSKAGAVGPMQFLPRTFRAYATDGDGDGRADVTNPADAVHTAARHLCANGGGEPEGLRAAVRNYNHSDAYVERVMHVALASSSYSS